MPESPIREFLERAPTSESRESLRTPAPESRERFEHCESAGAGIRTRTSNPRSALLPESGNHPTSNLTEESRCVSRIHGAEAGGAQTAQRCFGARHKTVGSSQASRQGNHGNESLVHSWQESSWNSATFNAIRA